MFEAKEPRMCQLRVSPMTRFLLSTFASTFLLAAPIAAIAQTPAPAAPAKPMTMPMAAPKVAAKPAAKPVAKVAAKPMAKPMVHKAVMKAGPTKAGDAAVEKLNEQSLAKAKAGL